jgi:AraC family transcriptional regulator of arabinose operon
MRMDYFGDIRFLPSGREMRPSGSACIEGRWPQLYSLQFDRKGKIFYQVNRGVVHEVEAPVLYITEPNNHYRYGLLKGDEWDHGWLCFCGARARRIIETGFSPLAPNGYIPVMQPVEVSRLFDSILGLLETSDESRHFEAVVYLEQLLGVVTASCRAEVSSDPLYTTFNILQEKIINEPLQEWDLQAEAKNIGLSYSHFRKLFKQIVGSSPHHYLLSARMQYAANEMRLKHIPVQEMAYQCGYDDPAQFSKVFKRHIGLSPRHYLQTRLFNLSNDQTDSSGRNPESM